MRCRLLSFDFLRVINNGLRINLPNNKVGSPIVLWLEEIVDNEPRSSVEKHELMVPIQTIREQVSEWQVLSGAAIWWLPCRHRIARKDGR